MKQYTLQIKQEQQNYIFLKSNHMINTKFRTGIHRGEEGRYKMAKDKHRFMQVCGNILANF